MRCIITGVRWSEYASDVYQPKAQRGRNSLFNNLTRLLSVVWATKGLHVSLHGTEFILEIDHQPLAFVNRANTEIDRVM